MLPTILSRNLGFERAVVSRALLKRQAPRSLACFSTQSWRKSPHGLEQQKCFHIDDDYYHRNLMGNRFFTAMHEQGDTTDEYDHIMRRGVKSVVGADVDDYDHRSLQNPQSSSKSTSFQPHSITAEQVDIDDFDHRSLQVDPFFAEKVLADKTSTAHVAEGDVDDYDHRALQDPVPEQTEDASKMQVQGDVDDYDHRSLESPPTTQPVGSNPRVPAPPAEAFILETGDVDDFDNRILQNQPPASGAAPVQTHQTNAQEADIDDYDHRALQTTPPSKDHKKGLGFEITDSDSRSKWALGNLSTKDIQQEKEARTKTSAEKLAIKHKQDDIRHHAWE